MVYSISRDKDRCKKCGFCENYVACPSQIDRCAESTSERPFGTRPTDECIGCGTCVTACPNEALEVGGEAEKVEVPITLDEKRFIVERTTVKAALESIGYKFTKYPNGDGIFAPCETGGCWSCALEINGRLMPSCTTAVKENMVINTRTDDVMRLVHGFGGHHVGGVGTPWQMKYFIGCIEAVCFACGCNFRCPQCQNWMTTYCGRGKPLSPKQAAEMMTATRKRVFVDRMTISGGESTLNRRWLVEYIKSLKDLNKDEFARFHVDTNGSILTDDYIDELVDAGMTDIGIDIKGMNIDTFMRITGLKKKELAEKYHKTAWNAVKYIIDEHDDLFLGIGIPYNRGLISLREIREMGEAIFDLDRDVQVCVLDYRPAFRNRRIRRPSYTEMVKVYQTLKDVGLSTVICQTRYGHIGPEGI